VCLTELQKSLINTSNKKPVKERSLRNIRKYFKGCLIKAMNPKDRIPVSHVIMQPANLTIREPVATEFMQRSE
jgi:hypothetical protein